MPTPIFPKKMAGDWGLGVLAKSWTAGNVKTRLAATIGRSDAQRAHRALVGLTLRRFRSLGTVRQLALTHPTVLSGTPPGPPGPFAPAMFAPAMAEATSPDTSDWQVTAQADGDLGNRIGQLLKQLQAQSRSDRVVVIGTDCPWLRPSDFGQALRLLDRYPVVMGPADDGGYYLIGISRPWSDSVAALFQQIDWGGPRVARQTRAAARESGLAIGHLRTLSDVDRHPDWLRLLADARRGRVGDRAFRDELLRLGDSTKVDPTTVDSPSPGSLGSFATYDSESTDNSSPKHDDSQP